MKREKFLKLLARHRVLVYLFIILLGVLFVLIGSYLEEEEAIKTFLFGIGGSLVASSVILGLNFLFFIEEEKSQDLLLDILNRWGLKAIYKTRQEMNLVCDTYIENELKNELNIIAFGLRSLRHSPIRGVIEEKVKKGLKIKILTMNPDSIYLKQRETEEGEEIGSIKKTILDLMEWVKELKKLSPYPDNINLKFYDGLPLDFYFQVDDHLFIGPYLYGKDSQQTISFEFKKCGDAEGYNYYHKYFEEIWTKRDSEIRA